MKCSLFLMLAACLFSTANLWITPANADDLLPADTPIASVINHYVNQRMAALRVQPTPPAEDTLLLRRTMLDLVGRPPTLVEAQAYAADENPHKRDELISRLIGSPGFVRHQADEMDQFLMLSSGGTVRTYLVKALEENRPWDQMFRDLLLGETDDVEQKGAIEFVKRRVSDLDKLTTEVSSIFLGVNVSCAQCHNHPFVDDWTQDHFYGMKSFFGRTFDNGGFVGERDYGLVSYKTTEGESREAKLLFITGVELEQPPVKEMSDKDRKAEKELLDKLKKDKEAPPAPEFSLRAKLVETALATGQNELFAKAIVNNLWARFYGRGLVDPVDQMHAENPPSHPELLDWLARDFINNGYNLQRLIDGLVRSEAYARSSRLPEGDYPPATAFAVGSVRPLRPEAYAAVLKMAATSPDFFPAEMSVEDRENRAEGIVSRSRTIARSFEQPAPGFQVSVDEALLMSNGDRIRSELLSTSSEALLGKLNATPDRAEAINLLFWNVCSRPPEAGEVEAIQAFLSSRQDDLPQAYSHVVWALLTSSECRFNY
ncbi:DUF1549 domain-containing protein [Lignipirellula cremea]|uniref:Cytochrome c domain-containing protein n=1 Tax=Lignipirellula cremea TaxID=2528010 RepID=A0A518DUL7_9BACT|nr:DUF1549 domain-containing protein [Lignipirellula cremea]QDU95533.1 hypothetical protein Pla8534_33480 [Lignipirellula cremea]